MEEAKRLFKGRTGFLLSILVKKVTS